MPNRFDIDIVLKVILKTHLHNSINTPICFHKFPMLSPYIAKIIDKDTISKLFKTCYPLYKNTKVGSARRSTLDLEPEIFVNIFLDSIEYAIANKETEIVVPNGCCDTPFCEYYEFYTILYEYFKKTEFRETVLSELVSIKKEKFEKKENHNSLAIQTSR